MLNEFSHIKNNIYHQNQWKEHNSQTNILLTKLGMKASDLMTKD